MLFSKNQVTDPSSDLCDTIDHSQYFTMECNQFGVSRLYCLKDLIRSFVDIFCQ